MSDMIPYALMQIAFGLPFLIGIVLIGAMTKGSARVLGMIGCFLLLIAHALTAVVSIMLPRIMAELSLSMAMASVPLAIMNVLGAIGMILVICAVVAGRRKQPQPQPFRPAGQQPMPPQGPYQPGPQPTPPQGPYQPGPYQPGGSPQ
ncbi:hypothetical protein [Microlunatus speluncae]|uniref:hypothetical protein n=1 Tax=Microlunatus speluncae TaxID=2594267 RepID=UPI0012665D37|nr:hypothetical protein [Microlunatus speluncae]